MNIDNITNARDQIGRQVAILQNQVNDLQDVIKSKQQMMEILSCLIAITESLNKVKNLERCSGILRCIDELGAAQEELHELYRETYGVKL